MTVDKWMTRELITIDKEDPVSLAVELLLTNDIRHLPVLSEGKLVGIITDRDLQEALEPEGPTENRPGIYYTIKDIKAEKIMTPNPVTILPNASIEQAARILFDRKIDCLPVKDAEGELIGIITVTDILRAFIEFMEILREGQRLDIAMEDTDYTDVESIINQSGGKVITIGIISDDTQSQRIYSFRIKTPNISELVLLLKNRGYNVLSFQ